jgi:GAF domain-containing protein
MAGKREKYRLGLYERVLGGLCSGKDQPRVLQVALEVMCKELGAQAGSIILVSAKDKKGKFAAVISKRPQALRRMTLSLERGVVGWCIRNKRMTWVPDVSRDRRYDPEISERIRFPTRNILCAPIKRRKTVIGALELINLKDKRPSQAKLDQFRAMMEGLSRILSGGK